MFLKIILIILGVILAVIVALFIFAQYLTFKSKRRRKAWLSTHSPAPLTEARKRVLTFGAILALYRNEELFDMAFDREVEEYAGGLADQWEISNREEALATIGLILAQNHSKNYDEWLCENGDSSEAQALYEEVAQALKMDVAEVKAVRSTYAWDTVRVIALSKWAYWLDYITEEEMWNFAEKAAAQASAQGKDWKEYTISFLLGRVMHGFGVSIADDCLSLLAGNRKDAYTTYSFR